MKQYFLVIDAGTGSIRAIVFDVLGNQVSIAQYEWNHLAEEGVAGSMGFDFRAGWELAKKCIKESIAHANIDAKQIIAVSASSMREGIVVYDKDKNELWGVANVDSRAGSEVAYLKSIDADMEREFYRSSGQTFALSAAPRLLWLKNNRPSLYEKTTYFTMISDWILFKLSGELACEPSNAGTAGSFSLSTRNWEKEQFTKCGLKDLFVPILESGDVLGKISKSASDETGLCTDTLVVMGGGDVQIGTAGLGANALGDAVVLGGSFWQQVVNVPTNATLSDEMLLRVNPHVVRGMSQAEGITFFTGLVMRWFRDTLGGGRSYGELEAMASKIPVGSHGILPIFSDSMKYGEWIHASPSFVGLGIDPQKYNIGSMFRALEENACIVSAINLENIKAFSGVSPKSLIFASGASQGPLWSQLLADVTGLEVKVPVVKEATALGVAMAAGIGAGVYKSFDEAGKNIVKMERSYQPNMNNFQAYQEVKERWTKVYAKQMELVREGTLEPMWKAPGI
ncbi:MAG TPA: autoinducer-2 kinase [Sulfuricurvum sp.]|nr:MAG: autoinducer-2 kinase [Campylobacterales bacterium 16-40-21]OZA01843.1 MAG: autoinducer-2 kinase [Sulfuricurvum sp. 17-40-25]HQS67224.1 autoinducer-2 kinase [Sulfuricurvum sp.]HQT36029.1 autoinducer-2 kinase [Sulfuricurvum sp.]